MNTIPLVSVGAVVDIAALPSGGATGVKIPKGFVYTGVALKEITKANGTSATATVKAGSTPIAAAFNIGGDSAIDAYKAATTDAKVAATCDLVITLAGSTAATTGVLEVVVVGYYVDGVAPFDADVTQDLDGDGSTSDDNVAKPDPYKQPEFA